MLFFLGGTRPEDDAQGLLLLFTKPSAQDVTMISDIQAQEGSIVRRLLGGWLWVVHSDQPGFAGRLRARERTLMVLRDFPFAPQIGGCVVLTNQEKPHALSRSLRP